MKSARILSIIGTRPHLTKLAPIHRAFEQERVAGRYAFEHLILHTGQHYDEELYSNFLEPLGLPKPDFQLASGGK